MCTCISESADMTSWLPNIPNTSFLQDAYISPPDPETFFAWPPVGMSGAMLYLHPLLYKPYRIP